MKQGWEYKKLGEVCEVLYGCPFDSSLFTEDNGFMPLIRIRDIKNSFTETFYKGSYSQEYVIKKGDYLIGMDGEFNVCEWKGVDALLNQRVCKVYSKNPESLHRRFLYWSLPLQLKKIEDLTPFVTVKHLSAKKIADIKIPNIPLDKQIDIATELDTLSQIIADYKEQLADYDKLEQSIFYDMFGDPVKNEKGWEVKKMGEIGTLQRGSGLSKKDLVEEGYPCILYGQIHTKFGAYIKKHIACIPNDLVCTAKIAHYGDLVMAITSEDVEGSCKSTAWMGDYDIAVGSDTAIFRHNQNGIYVSYYTRTNAFYHEKAKYARGFKVTHISTKEIETIPIILPPLPLQQQFASKIESIEQMKADTKAALQDAELLFNARMDYWFNA